MLNNHVFSLDDDGYCKLKKKEVTKGELPTVKKVIKSCPTKAVSIEEKEVKKWFYIFFLDKSTADALTDRVRSSSLRLSIAPLLSFPSFNNLSIVFRFL